MKRGDLRVSDDAVSDATGRDWMGWVEWIDARGGSGLDHQEIVALVRDEGEVESGWWQQMVTNGYEKLKGRRKTGQTLDAGFQVGVQRTVDAGAEEVWRLAIGPDGLEAWLGTGAGAMDLEEGAAYRLEEGARGEIRIVRAGEHRIRLTWQPSGWPEPSTIQLRVTSRDDRAVLSFHQERMPDQEAREVRRSHFRQALDRLEALLG